MSAPTQTLAFTPTPEQTAILDAVRDLEPGGLLKIQARAGTGKTSTLELLARSDCRAMLYLAYNADIAAAAKKRFPETVTVDVLLVTAHKSKGLEFDQVILADDFAALDKGLTAALKTPDAAESALAHLPEQELHLLYVAATRAQRLLQPNVTLTLMSKLADALAKIRLDHAANPVAPLESERSPPDVIDDDPEELRLMQFVYATFPDTLKTAMKIAAKRWGWDRETWAMQTAMLQDSMRRGCTVDELADAYRNPPPNRLMEAA